MAKCKRFLAFLLALVLSLSLLPTMALAADSASSDIAIVAPATAKVDDIITVTIQTSKAVDLYVITGGIQFDTGKLEVKSVAFNLDKTAAVPSGSADAALNTSATNKIGFYFIHSGSTYHLNANTVIATIQFKVLTKGTITLQGYEDSNLSDSTNVKISADSGIITSSIVAACNHKNAAKTEAIAATCTTAGNIAYWYCADCGKYFSDAACSKEVTAADVVISSKGHNYGAPVWTWSEDGKSASAKITCQNDASHTESGAAKITSAVKIAATCTTMGWTTYTAKITLGGTEYTDTRDVLDIAALEHSFTTYTDNGDGTATATCSHAGCTVTNTVTVGEGGTVDPTVAQQATATTNTAITEIADNTAVSDKNSSISVSGVTIENADMDTARMSITPKATATSADGTAITGVTYEVTPVVQVDGTETAITNEQLNGTAITFRLAIPSTMTGDYVTVSHYPDGEVTVGETGTAKQADWTKVYQIQGETPNRYVELSASEFSAYMLEQNTVTDYAAKIAKTGVFYETLSDALNDATSGDTVTLLKDTGTSADNYMVRDGVTLDLNGKTLTAGYVVLFGGKLADTAAAAGKLVVAKNHCAITANGAYLPVYVEGGYRFYQVSAITQGYQNNKLSFSVKFANAAAWTDILASTDSTINYGFTLNCDGQTMTFNVSKAMLSENSANLNGEKFGFTATITGLTNYTSVTAQAYAQMITTNNNANCVNVTVKRGDVVTVK